MTHLEWDLTTFLGVDSNYWDMEVLIEEGDPATEVDTSATGDARKSLAAGETLEEVVVVVDEPPA